MKTLKWTAATLLSMSLLLACNRDDENQNGEAAVEDAALAMNASQELDVLAEMSLEGDPQMKTAGVLSCATWNVDTTGPVNTITLDFGTSNCKGVDGKFRRGVLEIDYTDNVFQAGSQVSVRAIGYAVNDFEFNGSRTVTYNGLNSSNQPNSTIVSQLTIKKPNNGGTITWNSNRNRVWTSGFANFNPFDNEFQISGTASGVSANGVDFEMDILSPLVIKSNCSNVVAGELEISSTQFATRVLNYGNGSCDNKAEVTVNGRTRTITLR